MIKEEQAKSLWSLPKICKNGLKETSHNNRHAYVKWAEAAVLQSSKRRWRWGDYKVQKGRHWYGCWVAPKNSHTWSLVLWSDRQEGQGHDKCLPGMVDYLASPLFIFHEVNLPLLWFQREKNGSCITLSDTYFHLMQTSDRKAPICNWQGGQRNVAGPCLWLCLSANHRKPSMEVSLSPVTMWLLPRLLFELIGVHSPALEDGCSL